jgi:hypothetical protein
MVTLIYSSLSDTKYYIVYRRFGTLRVDFVGAFLAT